MKRAARFGFLLFSQPSSFRFDWSEGGAEPLVVFPALLQVTNDDAKPLSTPRALAPKEVVPL
jgi:hypothetical protein